ncbi:MAG TPA: hypothetical protein VHK26_03205 [Methyloceanibacter sp.]|jgi:hypothetical protein|nr:hypothetical protein [Methyloceanibacter sp.]
MSSGVELRGISVELVGDEIVVYKPGTVFLIAFKKPPHQRRLVVARCWLAGFDSKPLAEFRALAVQLAANKAHSLGWLVEAHDGKRTKPPGAKLLSLVHTRWPAKKSR